MKRTVLAEQWVRLDSIDLATLNVGRGTIEVLDTETQKMVPHKLTGVQLSLIKHAYECGLKRQALY
jgi:hypothetical protein